MLFEYAQGSIVGRDHLYCGKLLVGRNNQDACHVAMDDDVVVAVVCDGCGSGLHSEVGANIGARIIANRLIDSYRSRSKIDESMLRSAQTDILSHLAVLARSFGGNFGKTVLDYFLFTTIGVIMDENGGMIFAAGDGCYAFGDGALNFFTIGPFENNAPPYLSYSLIDGNNPERFKLKAAHIFSPCMPVIIGSDGLNDLYRSATKNIPGRTSPVGEISQFWGQEYFDNPDAICRKLRLINTQSTGAVRENGLLPDDTTLVAIKRKENKPYASDCWQ